jgi:hypothetical protein
MQQMVNIFAFVGSSALSVAAFFLQAFLQEARKALFGIP